MKTLARFYKAYYEWINYAIIALLCLLSCFFYNATWFLIAFVAVCACFYSNAVAARVVSNFNDFCYVDVCKKLFD